MPAQKLHPAVAVLWTILAVMVLIGFGFGYFLGRFDAKPEAPVAEEPVGASRVTVEVLYNKRPEVSIVTVDGVQYLSVNYLIGGAGAVKPIRNG